MNCRTPRTGLHFRSGMGVALRATVELLFVTSEITPYSRSGEIGDVCAALPKALRGGGHKVTVISPLWPGIDATGARARAAFERRRGQRRRRALRVHAARRPDHRRRGSDLRRPPRAFAAGSRAESIARAALVFVQAAMQVAAAREPKPDVVHAHGWFGAGSLALASAALPAAARVLTIYDTDAQGRARRARTAGSDRGAWRVQAAGAACSWQAPRRRSASWRARTRRCRSCSPRARRWARARSERRQADRDPRRARCGALEPADRSADPGALRSGRPARQGALQGRAAARARAADRARPAARGQRRQLVAGKRAARCSPRRSRALLRNELQLVIAGNDAELEQAVREPRAACGREAARRVPRGRARRPPRDRGGRSAAHPGPRPELSRSAPERRSATARCRWRGVSGRSRTRWSTAMRSCSPARASCSRARRPRRARRDRAARARRVRAAPRVRRAAQPLHEARRLSWERSARRYEHLYKTLKG